MPCGLRHALRHDGLDDRGVERLVLVVADRLVELGPRLHLGEHVLRAAVALQGAVELLLRLVGDAQRGDRPDHHLVAHRLELSCGEERRLAELGHVGQKLHAGHGLGEGAEHLGVVQRLGEDRVGARLDIALGARHGAVDALARRPIGAGDDEQMPARLGGGRDLGRHLVRVGELLVVQVAALLGQDLVLDMDGAGAGILEGAHHVHDVQRLAVARVAVDQHRQARRARDLADEEADLVDGDDAEVGQAHRRGHARAREIERIEARGLGLQRRHAVVRAGHLQDAGPLEHRAEALAGGDRGQVGGDEIRHLFLHSSSLPRHTGKGKGGGRPQSGCLQISDQSERSEIIVWPASSLPSPV